MRSFIAALRADCALRGLGALAMIAVATAPATADTLQGGPVKDNTLYVTPDGSLSNGHGEFIFAGNTLNNEPRRGVIEFDVSSIAPGSIVGAATLRLYMSKTRTGVQPVAVHRVLAEWGEGASDADLEEGFGAPSAPGDATWLHTFYSGQFWTAPGGDFAAAASASTAVNAIGFYSWSSAALAADVQAWVNDPASNHGWILIGAEGFPQTAKRFDSRENLSATQRPVLTVDYLPPAGCAGDADCDGDVDFFDIDPFVAKLGCPGSDPVACSDGCSWENSDVDGDGDVDFFDIDPFVARLGGVCP